MLAQAEVGDDNAVGGRVQDDVAQLQVSVDDVFLGGRGSRDEWMSIGIKINIGLRDNKTQRRTCRKRDILFTFLSDPPQNHVIQSSFRKWL